MKQSTKQLFKYELKERILLLDDLTVSVPEIDIVSSVTDMAPNLFVYNSHSLLKLQWSGRDKSDQTTKVNSSSL